MNKKCRLIVYVIIGILNILPYPLFSQNNHIVFEKLTHDFGTFSEDSELQKCIFKFTNHQKKAIAIAQVQSTCGCAVPQYTKEVIPPGKSGNISITYNPQGRPGGFNRIIIVSFSGQPEKVRLSIKGNVTPGVPRKNKTYPYVIGDMQLRTTGLKFKRMQITQQRSIMVINSGNSPLRTVIQSDIPALSACMYPDILQPDQKGEIQILCKDENNAAGTLCIRIKENTRQQKKAGTLYLIIEKEDCNQ